jgi:hypothetical protein
MANGTTKSIQFDHNEYCKCYLHALPNRLYGGAPITCRIRRRLDLMNLKTTFFGAVRARGSARATQGQPLEPGKVPLSGLCGASVGKIGSAYSATVKRAIAPNSR